MPTPTTHTPTPWHIAITGGQTTAGCPLVGIIPELRTIQHDRATYLHPVDAQHIVHCVNTHAALVAALEGVLFNLECYADQQPNEPFGPHLWQQMIEYMNQATQALALARKE